MQQVIGLVLMVVGVVVALVTYATSLNQDDVRDVISSGTLVVAMVVLTLLGAALFIGATVTRFLRFWMLRQLYEGQANAERLSEAVSTVLTDGAQQDVVDDAADEVDVVVGEAVVARQDQPVLHDPVRVRVAARVGAVATLAHHRLPGDVAGPHHPGVDAAAFQVLLEVRPRERRLRAGSANG